MFQNAVDLSEYIIYTYDRLSSPVQNETQQLLTEAMVYQNEKRTESWVPINMNCSYFRQPKEKRGEKRHKRIAKELLQRKGNGHFLVF